MKKCEVVSLGVNCLSRTVLTRGGIKLRKADGELSCPFDLVAHPTNTVLKCLETNFENYFDDLFFELIKRNIFDFRGKGLWQKKDGTKFYHDKDCKLKDKEKIINRIKNRINNFNAIISSDKPVVFVMTIYSEADCLNEIYEALAKLRNNKPFNFVVISFDAKFKNLNPNIKILEIPSPDENFIKIWNTKKYINSKLGKYVEKMICDFVQLNIDDLLPERL